MKKCFIRHEQLHGSNLWSLHRASQNDVLSGHKDAKSSKPNAGRKNSPKKPRLSPGRPATTIPRHRTCLERDNNMEGVPSRMSPVPTDEMPCPWAAPSRDTVAASPGVQKRARRYSQLQDFEQTPNTPCCNCAGHENFQDNSSTLRSVSPLPSLSPPAYHPTEKWWTADPAPRLPLHTVPDYMPTIMMMPTFQVDAALLEYSITHPTELALNEAWLQNAMFKLNTDPIPAL